MPPQDDAAERGQGDERAAQANPYDATAAPLAPAVEALSDEATGALLVKYRERLFALGVYWAVTGAFFLWAASVILDFPPVLPAEEQTLARYTAALLAVVGGARVALGAGACWYWPWATALGAGLSGWMIYGTLASLSDRPPHSAMVLMLAIDVVQVGRVWASAWPLWRAGVALRTDPAKFLPPPVAAANEGEDRTSPEPDDGQDEAWMHDPNHPAWRDDAEDSAAG